jgi:hypothetical protein
MVKAEIKYYLTAWDCNGTPLKQVRVIVSPIETLSEFLTDKKKRIDYLKKIEGCVNIELSYIIEERSGKLLTI